MNINNSNPADIARAMIEGMLSGLADAVDSLVALGVKVERILLIGGAAKNPAVPVIASSLFGREVLVPPIGEYVANGAAKQAAWALLGQMPQWDLGNVQHQTSAPTPGVMEKYRMLKEKTTQW
jgi:xylulokinase